MHKLLVSAFALSLLLGTGAAMADQVVGTVESVSPDTNTVVVNGQPYTFEPAVKLKPADLKPGDKVRLEYDSTSFVVYEADHAK